jgi:hypothetical protein
LYLAWDAYSFFCSKSKKIKVKTNYKKMWMIPPITCKFEEKIIKCNLHHTTLPGREFGWSSPYYCGSHLLNHVQPAIISRHAYVIVISYAFPDLKK